MDIGDTGRIQWHIRITICNNGRDRYDVKQDIEHSTPFQPASCSLPVGRKGGQKGAVCLNMQVVCNSHIQMARLVYRNCGADLQAHRAGMLTGLSFIPSPWSQRLSSTVQDLVLFAEERGHLWCYPFHLHISLNLLFSAIFWPRNEDLLTTDREIFNFNQYLNSGFGQHPFKNRPPTNL